MRHFVQGLLTSVFVLSAAASGCQPEDAVSSVSQGIEAPVQQSIVQANTTFAFTFFRPAAAVASPGPNVVLSPYSVSAVLSMLDVGAAGETATQIERTLALPGSGADLATAYAALLGDDQTHGSSAGNKLTIACSLWGQQGMHFKESFLATLADGYSAPLRKVDFAGDAASATGLINQWVLNETEGEIPSLFESRLAASTRLVLANAVYFKGKWATAFDPKATRQRPFTLKDGRRVEVPTMNGTLAVSRGAGNGFSVVELPYQGGATAFDLLLPDGDLAELEAQLTPRAVTDALKNLGSAWKVNLHLPKFSVHTSARLDPVLATLGITDAFTPGKADLSGIDGKRDLHVNVVVQKAMIEVDEHGTVAAAATGVGIVTTSVEVHPTVRIDRPFMFLIRNTVTGSVLFTGHVQDPRAR